MKKKNLFFVFLRTTVVFGLQNKFSFFFLMMIGPIWFACFFENTSIVLGYIFLFISRNLLSKRFRRFQKIWILKSKGFSKKNSVFYFSCLRQTHFFEKKPHLIFVLVITEKISASSVEPLRIKFSLAFSLLSLQNALERGI